MIELGARRARRRRLLVPAGVCAVLAAVLAPTSPAVAGGGVPAATVPSPRVPSSVTFSGAGWGHGVGLSQYGALGMARQGSTAAEIVRHYYTGTTVAPVRDDQQLRINLLHRTGKVLARVEALAPGARLQVKVKGSRVVPVGPRDRVKLVRRAGLVKAKVKLAGGGKRSAGKGSKVNLRWSGTRSPGATGSAPALLNVSSTSAGLAGSGHRYRYGSVQVATTPGSGSGLEVINLVLLHDEYLRGIAEVPSSWPAAALQAQVLASRSYALSKYGSGKVRAACRCHMDDGGGPYYDQTFVGYQPGKAWRAAVKATDTSASTGLAVLYGGKAITAFYTSSTGGRTQASKDVWGGDLPYAQSVDDHWSLDPTVSPWAVWSPRVRSQAQLAAAFGLPDVLTLDLSDRTVAGALAHARATSTTGRSATITGASFASRLGLPSRWVWRAAGTAVAADPVAASVAAAPAGRTVVLAPSDEPVPAAIAAAFAAVRGLPLLLTPGSGLAPAVRSELTARAVRKVYAVGSTADLPAAVLAAVGALRSDPKVVRLGDGGPAALSAEVAGRLNLPAGTPALVASAAEPRSVLAAAAVAGRLRQLLLVLPAGATGVPTVTADRLAATRTTSTLLVARPTAVPDVVGRDLPGVRRVGGADAAASSAQLALVALPAAARTVVGLGSSGGPVTSAAVVAATGEPVLWTAAALGSSTRSVLRTAATSTLRAIGAVPAVALQAARRA
ncbi:MAG TPA: SpoIID/LytB domain-containing protein [Candidatus Nanopelagicales bacterium]|nr:SpoIID/LytB domain-containing protein [Candidatus Nanopelagicales bacterium]